VYADSKAAERLAIAQKEFGFTPTYHSVADVIAFEDQLRREGKYTFDDAGAPDGVKNLTSEQSQWMLNEQVLVKCDAVYFLTRYAFVKNSENVIERFRFRVPQRLMFDIICDLESRGFSIEIQILKARQLGVSTLVALLIAHRIIFSYGVNAVLGSADRTKTMLMANMLLLCYDCLPCWLRPKWTRRVESDQGMLVFGQNATGVSFQHGAQASGIARGTTPTVYHLSECASFTDPVNQIEAALFKAVHASPSVFGILESTGEGNIGWWADTWRASKEKWARGMARLCPLFLPWFCGVDIWPTPTWSLMHPTPADWRPNSDTRKHLAKARLYVASNPLLRDALITDQKRRGVYPGGVWDLPRHQQWFWEVDHEEHKAKDIESTFFQEMAGDDEEALQRSSESVFGHETIVEVKSRVDATWTPYGIVGQSIEEDHEPTPEYVDYKSERIPVRYASPKGTVYRWELVPLVKNPGGVAIDEKNPEDVNGMLMVWHPPKPRVNYSIGIDTAEGIGKDSTTFSVWALGYNGMPDVQVAELSSPWINHVEAFAFGMALVAYYGQHMQLGETKWRQPYVSIEQVAAVGDTCQGQMNRMGHTNFHKMPRYDHTARRIMKEKRSPSAKTGWFTYGYTRGILTTNFVHAAQTGWITVNSPWMIGEMETFERHATATGKLRMEHEDGKNDDRIFAGAIAVFCPHDTEPLTERSKKRSVETSGLPPIDLSPFRGNVVPASALRKPVTTLNDVLYSGASDLERHRY
jgi:hypothetical protein